MTNSNTRIKLTLVVIVSMVLCLLGCTESEKVVTSEEEVIAGPVFYPKPPDAPRLQFLTSYAGADVVITKKGGFEGFVLGGADKKEVKKGLVKPFGVNIFDNKIYVCDIAQGKVVILNPDDESYTYLTLDKRMVSPTNIAIEPDGTKYVTDSGAGAVFVFNKANTMTAIMLRDLDISPIDIVVSEDRLYVADSSKKQIIVVDKKTGKEIFRFGGQGIEPGQFQVIAGIAINEDEDIYVSDKIMASVTVFSKEGIFKRKFGTASTSIYDFVRPKGLDIDREGRMWIVDTATAVAKIYSPEDKLMLFFGLPTDGPVGSMTFPIDIKVDYDHIEYFQKFAVAGAELEAIILVANQYGNNKVAVYGLGTFPQ